MTEPPLDPATVRLRYRALVGDTDPAREWLARGVTDARFAAGHPTGGVVVRGADDLVELHDIVDDVFGLDVLPRPRAMSGETRVEQLAIARPAVTVPFLDGLRPVLERRGLSFWTWKSAREAMARRLHELDALTLAATRTDG